MNAVIWHHVIEKRVYNFKNSLFKNKFSQNETKTMPLKIFFATSKTLRFLE